ncbi:MAG: integral rane sensor signal transduction histidine kinase [Segetibacter sp.]|nr:integral rane sensor signal transduction histidine kinase [Segetibacter sp.]
MNKLYFLLLCLFPVSLFAQSSIPEPFIINSDTTNYQMLGNVYWQIIEDTTSAKMNIENVTNPPVSNAFHQNSIANKNPGYPVKTYWIRFKLKNNLPHNVNIILQQKSAYADFYISGDEGNWIHKTTGQNKSWSERDGYKLIMAIPVAIKPGKEITVYERLEFDYRISRPKPIQAGFGFTEKMIENNYVDNDSFLFKTILGSFFIGLLFFAAVFNFFFFLVVHERVYFYYALCLLFGTINEYHNIFFHVFFRDHPSFINTNGVFFLIFVNFFAIQMERYFLHTFFHYPRWDKVLRFSIFIQLLAALAVYFVAPHLSNDANNMVWNVWDWSQGIVLMCILTTFLLYIRNKDKSARQFVIACLPVATVWVVNYIIMNRTNSAIAIEWNKYYDRLELLCISSLVIILSWILFDRYNILRKENAERALLNERLAKQKEIERSQLIAQQKVVLEEEVAARTAELKQSLEDLKAAQKQLVQSEKMASLGELTAGIAHEIQNPLNFVNNFSEVSVELLEELKDGALTTLKEEYKIEAQEVMADLTENLQKIKHHGKRADAIVKAMLEHSNSRNSKKEPTNINVLTDKYFHLTYSGVTAKDKTFKVKLETHFDESIGKIEVIQQDIGRVLVNLFNNAFYSVKEKKKQAPLPSKGGIENAQKGYEPTVTVTTSLALPSGGRGAVVSIHVRDNGIGIPQKIIDKIFQPFFTTKPTGQGTGLGLSLSYDIIKAQGGELTVETKEGEFAEFIIQLPVQESA